MNSSKDVSESLYPSEETETVTKNEELLEIPPFRPMLLAIAGEWDPDTITILKNDVIERLDQAVPAGGISWVEVKTIADCTEETLFRALEELLYDGKVLEWIQRGLITSPIVINTIVLYQRKGQTTNEVKELLNALENTFDFIFAKRKIDFTFSLIYLNVKAGADIDEVVSSDAYWPRFFLQAINAQGIRIQNRHLIQACITLLVALAVSNLIETIDKRFDRNKINWLVPGVSSLSVRIAALRAYFILDAFLSIIKPLLGDRLGHNDEVNLNYLAEQYLRGEKTELTPRGFVSELRYILAKQRDWKSETYGARIALALAIGTPLPRTAEVVTDLEETVFNYYLDFEDIGTRQVQDTILAAYKNVLDIAKSLVRKEAVQNISLQYFALSGHQVPKGLNAVVFLLERIEKSLVNHNESQGLGLMLTGDKGLRVIAQEDAQLLFENRRLYHRFQRSILSPLLAFSLILPVWLILGKVLEIFTHWESWLVYLTAGVVLLLATSLEYIFWYLSLLKNRRRLEILNHERIDQSLKLIEQRIIDDYQKAILLPINNLLFLLKRLTAQLNQSVQYATGEIEEIRRNIRATSKIAGNIYWLSDFESCHKWVNLAKNTIESRNEPFSEAIIGMIEGRYAHSKVLDTIMALLKKVYREYFIAGQLHPLVISSNIEKLEGAKHLRWLLNNATPLGQIENPQEQVFMISTSASLSGGVGNSNPDWQVGTIPLITRQPHEFICLKVHFRQGI